MRTRECLFCDERTPDSELDSRGICLTCGDDWDELDEDDKWDVWREKFPEKSVSQTSTFLHINTKDVAAFIAVSVFLFLLLICDWTACSPQSADSLTFKRPHGTGVTHEP